MYLHISVLLLIKSEELQIKGKKKQTQSAAAYSVNSAKKKSEAFKEINIR